MKISACWIVKDEAETIKESIHSVKNCAEELIVVDTGSTDDTVAIAKECGARVEHFAWINDFSAAKNHALSFAKGDYVIFLDADEYFAPPLKKADAALIAQAFENSGADELILDRHEIDKESNTHMAVTPADRILRRATVHYEGKTHDAVKRRGGKPPNAHHIKAICLEHTGYSNAMLDKKGKRNISNLEAERLQLTNPLELYINACYLLREYLYFNEYEAARKYTRYLLQNYQYMKPACKTYEDGFVFIFYCAVHVAELFPEAFDRNELRGRLFGGIKENYPGTKDAALIDLYFQLKFHYKEARFLREAAAVEQQLDGKPAAMQYECNRMEAEIFGKAAEAAHKRGDQANALRWARRAAQHS